MTKLPSQYKHKKKFWILFSGCFSLLVCYFVLFGMTIANVLDRQNSEREISAITANVSKVEFSYLNEKSSINASFARSLGFIEVEKTGITQQKKVGNISLNEI